VVGLVKIEQIVGLKWRIKKSRVPPSVDSRPHDSACTLADAAWQRRNAGTRSGVHALFDARSVDRGVSRKRDCRASLS